MSKSTNLLYWGYRVKENWERWDWEIIYRNRKVDQLSTYRGSEGVGGYSWREKAKVFECFFKKLTKSSIDKNSSIKRLWVNLDLAA